MSVNIDIELTAGDVKSEIMSIAGALESLDEAEDGLDLSFDDIDVDEITGEIGQIANLLEGMDLSNLEDKISRLEDLDGNEIEVGVQHKTPDGSTNDGDSTGSDPPGDGDSRSGGDKSSSFDKDSYANKIADLYGFDPEQIEVFDEIDKDVMKEMRQNIENSARGAIDDIGNKELGTHMIPDAVAGIKKDLESLDREEIDRKAKRAGVWDHDAGREMLIDRLRSQEFNQDGVAVRTSEGMLPLQDALRRRSGINGPETDKEPEYPEWLAQLELDRRRLGREQQERLEADRGFINPSRFDIDNPMDELKDGERADLYRQAVGLGNPDDEDRSRPSGGRPSNVSELIKGNSILSKIDGIKSKGDAFDALGDSSDAFGKKLRRLKPTMGKYMQLMAALLPIMVALGVQLLGVAAAMGAVAVAGAAIMGLGLLGQGDSMAESMANAKKSLKDLKKELFDMAQPLMKAFSPMQSRMFDAIPDALRDIFEEMEGMKAFEDTLFELGGALAGGMEEAISIVNDNEQAISQLATRFAGLIGSGLLDMFEWLIQTAYENQQLIVELGSALLSLAVVAYNVSMAIARITTALKPLFDFLAFLTGFLNNKLIVGFLSVITVLVTMMVIFTKVTMFVWAFYQAILAVQIALAVLGSGGMLAGLSTFFGTLMVYIQAAIAHFSALQLAAIGAAAAIAATGIGALAVGGGLAVAGTMSGPPGGSGVGQKSGVGGGGGGGRTYIDNRTVNVEGGNNDYADLNAVSNKILEDKQMEEGQSLPSTNTSSIDQSTKNEN